MEGIRPEKALVFLRSLFLPGVSESPGFRTGWPQAGGQRPPGLQRAPGAVEQPAPGRGRGCAVMIAAEAAAQSALPAVPGAAAAAGVSEREEPAWPWVSSGPRGNRRGPGGAGPGAPASCPSHDSCLVERCPDPGAGAAHPPTAG